MKKFSFVLALSLFMGLFPYSLRAFQPYAYDDFGCIAVIYPYLAAEYEDTQDWNKRQVSLSPNIWEVSRVAAESEYIRCLVQRGFDREDRGISEEEIRRMREELVRLELAAIMLP